jgi:hypothetical protein
MKKRMWTLPLLAVIATLAGCMKFETYPVTAQSNGCKISTMYLYGATGSINDTARFTWTGNNITKVVLNAYHYDIEYDGSLVTRRNFYLPGATTPDHYDRIVYNPAANYILTRYELFEEDAPGSYYRADSTVYQFTNGFMTGLTQWTRAAASDPIAVLRRKLYTYNGSNLSQVQDIRYHNGAPADTTITSVSTNSDPNYYRAIHDWFWAISPMWVNDHQEALKNSLTRDAVAQETIGSIPIQYSYTTDAKGNLEEMRGNGVRSTRFAYNCP